MIRRDDEARRCIRSSMLGYRSNSVARTLEDLAAEGIGIREEDSGNTSASLVPAFAADMTLLLRSNLGPLEYNTANLLLVNAEYHRVCRGLFVRCVDQAAHRQHVINAFFFEDVFDQVGRTRSRLPRWLNTLMGHSRPSVQIAC